MRQLALVCSFLNFLGSAFSVWSSRCCEIALSNLERLRLVNAWTWPLTWSKACTRRQLGLQNIILLNQIQIRELKLFRTHHLVYHIIKISMILGSFPGFFLDLLHALRMQEHSITEFDLFLKKHIGVLFV